MSRTRERVGEEMASQLMAPLDAVLMTAELLGNPMHVAVLLVLTPPPGSEPSYVDRLYDDAVTAGIEIDPALLRHPHRGLDTGGLWTWRHGAGLDLTSHVRRHTLETGSREELYELVGRVHETPLARDRPLWEAVLVDGLSDGRFAFYVKVHHAVVDGVSGLRLIEESMSTDPGQRDSAPFFGFRTHGTETGPHRSGRLPFAVVGGAVRTAGAAVALG